MKATDCKAAIAAIERRLSHTEIAASLALTSKPDYRATFRDFYSHGSYLISAYGLTRCDGGYITIRFRYKGQKDSVFFHLFDDWRQHSSSDPCDRHFRQAAEQIAYRRDALLNGDSK